MIAHAVGVARNPATFLDDSFIEGANDYDSSEVKEALAEWREANPDILLP